MPELSPQEWLMGLLEHYCIPGEAREAFPSWSEELDDIILWKMEKEVKSLKDKLNKLENDLAAARLSKEDT